MFLFLTVVQALVAAMLVGVILVQKSEGGGLGVGGSPSGLMSARGAANFLTRATGILAGIFVLLSIGLAALAVNETSGRDIDTSLQRNTAPASAPVQPAAPADPLGGTANPAAPDPAQQGAPAGDSVPADPLGGAAKQ
jgi:preprotein translocase subunit SecG